MSDPKKPGTPASFEPWDVTTGAGAAPPAPPGAVPPQAPAQPPPAQAPRPAPGTQGTPTPSAMPASWPWTAAGSPSPAGRAQGALDARPILQRRADSIWSRSDRARDDLYDALTRFCDQEQLDALVVKSFPFTVPAWVKFECWLPLQQDALLTERGSVTISVNPREFHEYDFEYRVDVADRGTARVYDHLHDVSASFAVELARYLMRRGPKPRLARLKLRESGWQLWRPKNKIKQIGRDWALVVPPLVGMLGLALLTESFLAMGGLGQPTQLGDVGVLAIGLAALLWIFLRRRPVTVRSSGKPDEEPRNLRLVDSWQAVVTGLGADATLLRDRLLAQLRTNAPPNLRSRLEHIWYWGLDGKEEREQIVLVLGRAVCFCHLYGYGNELYVGWAGHVNYGQWVERTVARGRDRTTGSLAEINTVESGSQAISEYDLTDLNCLMEWTHSRLSQEVKRLMKERQIDAEIDFRIQRGERQGLTGEQRESSNVIGAVKKTARGLQQRLRRTG